MEESFLPPRSLERNAVKLPNCNRFLNGSLGITSLVTFESVLSENRSSMKRGPVGVYIPRHLRAPDTVLLELTIEISPGGPVERLTIHKVENSCPPKWLEAH